MDRICQYSTIIFSGNVSVLLVVAIMTDYWEYRGFHRDVINASIPRSNTTHVIFPSDTGTHFIIRYFWDPHVNKLQSPSYPGDQAYYQPPATVHKWYGYERTTSYTQASNSTDLTFNIQEKQMKRYQDVIVLFQQYGNLYRDCDNLEVGVQKRLGFTDLRESRCFNFITTNRGGYVDRELPAVRYLERSAFTFAVVCIISSVVSVVAGAYGSLAQDRQGILCASTSALVSAMTLTISIALFHGKCHLLHRRTFMAGLDIPYKRIINAARTHYYGWSFVLAWICVVLCFVHTWVWLLKAQDIPDRIKSSRQIRDGIYYRGSYAGSKDRLAVS